MVILAAFGVLQPHVVNRTTFSGNCPVWVLFGDSSQKGVPPHRPPQANEGFPPSAGNQDYSAVCCVLPSFLHEFPFIPVHRVVVPRLSAHWKVDSSYSECLHRPSRGGIGRMHVTDFIYPALITALSRSLFFSGRTCRSGILSSLKRSCSYNEGSCCRCLLRSFVGKLGKKGIHEIFQKGALPDPLDRVRSLV